MTATTVDASHSGTRALRRVMRHYVRKGRHCLSADEPSDEAVHAARKSIKKSRAALRLLRPTLGERRFRRANRTLRGAAQALNPLRDAHVLMQTLAGLCRDDPALQHNRTARRLAVCLREELSTARERMTARSLRTEADALRQVERRTTRWKVGRHGWSVLGPAICRVYRKGRKVLPTASNHPADAALHEWRKQVKYLRYALRMLAPMRPGKLGALEKQAGGIAEQLGESHDLALLQLRAASLTAGSDGSRRQLLHAIEQLRSQRAFSALVAGERLFQPRPRDFERAMGRAWRRWRRHA